MTFPFDVAALAEFDDHEEVVHHHDDATGLDAVIAVHSTVLGPSLGGVRFFPYPDLRSATRDVLRLASAMTLKAAVSALPLGGGKAVIIGDPATIKTDALLGAFGAFVEGLDGRYLTAEDVGTAEADIEVIAEHTRFVTGRSRARGGSGDPSPATARGLVRAMEAVSAHLWGSPVLRGRRVVIVGVGKVGGALAGHLAEAGCDVAVADVVDERAQAVAGTTGAVVVTPTKAIAQECDILSPCALAGLLREESVPALQCAAVVGGANNQLAAEADADRLASRGVLYAPDYVANAGGIINIAEELAKESGGYDPERAMHAVDGIFQTMAEILDEAATTATTPERVAVARAERELAAVR